MTETIDFELRPEHLKLLCHAYIGWNNCEFGAPEIDPKRPYGNSQVLYDIAGILGLDMGNEDEGIPEETKEVCRKLHRETRTALQIVLCCQTFEPGLYRATQYLSRSWRRVDDSPTATNEAHD